MPANGQDLDAMERWRLAQLVQAGLPGELAARVARDERYDVHELIELVGHGCAPELAVRILEPTGVGSREGAGRRSQRLPQG